MTEHAPDVLVLGAGVIGLTTAVCLAEGGLAVTVQATEAPQDTTSAVAGAIWGPHLVEDSDRATRWATGTLEELAGLAGRAGTGVRLVSGVEAGHGPAAPPPWAAPLAALGPLHPVPAGGLPAGFTSGWHYTAPVVHMPVYLDYLLARLTDAGARLVTGPAQSLAGAAAAAAAPVVVNCTGMGAHGLVPDPSLTPVRGQVVVAENPGITEFFIGQASGGHELSYVFPHAGRVVLGGTTVAGDWSTEPHPQTAGRILRDCTAAVPRLAGARVLAHRVGLRPVRPRVRLEAEPPATAGGLAVVHNYGHGGGGVTLSWGCARDAARLARAAAAGRAGGS
jgi:D-amino-acid oxidase